MRVLLRFVFPLLLVLGLLAFGAAGFFDRMTRGWFERDVELRAKLAVSGAHAGLVQAWRQGDGAQVARILEAITRDERIMAAAACGAGRVRFAATSDYPAALDCAALDPLPDGAGAPFTVRGGPVRAHAIAVSDDRDRLGHVLVVQDMSFATRREQAMRRLALVVFAILAVAAALVTGLLARFAWRSWTAEMRRLLRGTPPRREFQPLLADVRELVERLAAESSAEGHGLPWTPSRLKQTLRQHLRGEKVIIAANREPYIHERTDDGGIRVLHPASGLVTALEPVMRACSGVWVAHGSGSADRETVDRHGRVRVPPGEESYYIRRVWLGPDEEEGYYYGFSNEGLWPLCHIAHARPTFRATDWEHYRRVNRRFADAVCSEVDSVDPIVFVQDYHFALAPRMIRERLPRATILTFWHIPWPNAERFGICPWRNELLEGMLGSSIIGFHTQLHCNNFMDSVDRFLETRIDREQHGVEQHGRMTLVRPYPISIEWPNRWAASAPPIEECRAQVRKELGLEPDALLGVGVDRLDYTKGVEERMLAVERLLERHPRFRGRFSFVQLAAPSRTAIERYRDLNHSVEAIAARINERFGQGGYRPILLLREHHEPPTVFRHYRAADVCYVSSLHDGMNLVAKEFVAAHDDERGVLLLSCFTGAARELTEALVVNPYDLEETSAALATALDMPLEEQRDRMRAMRRLVAEFNVYRWAGRMLVDAARVRQRDRLSSRFLDRMEAEGIAAP